jgi:hypothetical protein
MQQTPFIFMQLPMSNRSCLNPISRTPTALPARRHTPSHCPSRVFQPWEKTEAREELAWLETQDWLRKQVDLSLDNSTVSTTQAKVTTAYQRVNSTRPQVNRTGEYGALCHTLSCNRFEPIPVSFQCRPCAPCFILLRVGKARSAC